MNMNNDDQTLLGPYRVLDLTDEKGLMCGRILGDMGADVIKIEQPGGDPARNIGPFYNDSPDPEKSLFWFFMCMNKKSITLNLETVDGKEIFKRLVKDADFVLESFDPGYMSSLGLGYDDLEKINPGIIMVSITPFGQEGPYTNYKMTDLTTWAMSGPMYLTGDPDRAPLQVSFPQAFLHTGATAAVGGLVAHYHRQASGEGQHVDVSAQEVCSFIAMEAPAYWEILQSEIKRAGPGRMAPLPKGEVMIRFIYPCKDGHVFYLSPGANVMLSAAKAWTEWLAEEGISTDHLKHFGWPEIDFMEMTPDDFELMQETLGSFIIKHTKKELYEEALKRDIPLVPVASPADVYTNVQLKERDFWMAPLTGEHNEEIYGSELGFSGQQMVILRQAGVI
jgi:benzylsuccinate CoA-transferase BbsE subunit